MQEIQIGDKLISDNSPTFVIAEIGVNHNGSLRIAKQLIDVCVEAGVDAVKFQKRKLSDLYTKDTIEKTSEKEQSLQYTMQVLKNSEFSSEEYYQIVDYCKQKNILFMCTAFDKPSADFLEQLEIPAYKTSSPDLTNIELLEYIASKNKPIIASTGMSTIDEIEFTVNFLKSKNNPLILLHCNSTYPADFKDINLKFMHTLKDKFGLLTGYSGHERGISTSLAAVAMGARVIERHVTLDRAMDGPDHRASLEPTGIKKLIRDIRNFELAHGTGKRWMTQGEYANRLTLAKSLVARTDIAKGDVITREHVTTRSPGLGISPQRMIDIIGKTALRNIEIDENFIEEDFGFDRTSIPDIAIAQKWGLIARFSDLDKIVPLSFKGKCIEIHLTYGDLEFNQFDQLNDYEQELIIHAPDFVGQKLADLAGDDREERIVAIEMFQKSIDLARKAAKKFKGTSDKGPKVVLHPGGHTHDDPLPKSELKRKYQLLADSLSKLDTSGVQLLIENMPPLPWYYGGQRYLNIFIDPGEIEEFCLKYGYGIVYDTSHAKLACNYMGYDFNKYSERLMKLAEHVHISDGGGSDAEGLQVGDGEIDFSSLVPIINKPDVTMVPEIWMGHKNKGAGFWTALERLEKYYKS
jgi:sialic acid synthase SpsE/sugar phosphate isomerase/epimerase